jgi:hypothetical protein
MTPGHHRCVAPSGGHSRWPLKRRSTPPHLLSPIFAADLHQHAIADAQQLGQPIGDCQLHGFRGESLFLLRAWPRRHPLR